MKNDLQREAEHERGGQFEGQIELIDLLRVAWKWKYLVVGGTILCVVVAALVSIFIPEVYRISMLIDSGVARGSLSGNPSYLAYRHE